MAWICRVISPMIDYVAGIWAGRSPVPAGADPVRSASTTTTTCGSDRPHGQPARDGSAGQSHRPQVRVSAIRPAAPWVPGSRSRSRTSRLVVKSEVERPRCRRRHPVVLLRRGRGHRRRSRALAASMRGGDLRSGRGGPGTADHVPGDRGDRGHHQQRRRAHRRCDSTKIRFPRWTSPPSVSDLIFSDAFIDDVQIVGQGAPPRHRRGALLGYGLGTSVAAGVRPRHRSGGRARHAQRRPSGDRWALGSHRAGRCAAPVGRAPGCAISPALYRAAVYPYSYTAPNPVPLAELANLFNPFGLGVRRSIHRDQSESTACVPMKGCLGSCRAGLSR